LCSSSWSNGLGAVSAALQWEVTGDLGT